MAKEPDTELTVLDIPSRSTKGSTGDDPEDRPPRQKDLVYVVGVKNDSGPVGPAIARCWKKRNHGLSLDDVATQPPVFDDDKLSPLYQPGPQYENVHRFDPDERWTWREEIPLIRKIDWRITAWAAIGKGIPAELPGVPMLCDGTCSNQAYSILHARSLARKHRPGKLARMIDMRHVEVQLGTDRIESFIIIVY